MTLSRERLTTAAAVAVLAAALYAVYRLWPDALHNYDGVIFSGVIEARDARWRGQLFSYAGHFLYNPTGFAFHRFLASVGAAARGYEAAQILSALLGAASAAVVLLTLRGMALPWRFALPLALLTAHGGHFWQRAAEASVYMPGIFCAAAALGAAWAYHESGRARWLAAMAAASALAALYHLQHVFWAPGLVCLAWRRNRRDAAVFAGLYALAAGLPQVLAFRLFNAAAWKNWFLTQGDNVPSVWGLHPGQLEFSFPWRYHASALVQVLWVPPRDASDRILLGAAVLLAAALAASAWRAWRSRGTAWGDDRRWLVALGLFAAGVFFFQSFWASEMTKYSHLGLALALAAGAAARGLLRAGPLPRGSAAALWALWLLTAAHNARAGLRPASRWEENAPYRTASVVAQLMEPDSVIVLSGLEEPFLKVYLPVLFGRPRVALDMHFAGLPKEKATALLRDHLREQTAAGTPVYALSDVVEGRFLSAAPARWGLTVEDARALLSGHAALPVLEVAPGLRLYRLWPSEGPWKLWEHFAARSAQLGNDRELVSELEYMREREPRAPVTLWQNLGLAYWRLGRLAEAEARADAAVRLYPKDRPLLQLKAALMYLRGDRDGSAVLLRRHWPRDEADRMARNFALLEPPTSPTAGPPPPPRR
jgi:hypothetical protein